MMNKKNILSEETETILGEEVSVKRLKYKTKKETRHSRNTTITCPNCLSKLQLGDTGHWECTGNRLRIWEKDFLKYYTMTNSEKISFLAKLSSSSRFEELYEYWKFSFENNKPEEFTCGYTNNISLPLPSNKVKIPDPIVVGLLEKKLGRPLSEEELFNEVPLYEYKGKILTEHRKGAKDIVIPFILLPDETEVKV